MTRARTRSLLATASMLASLALAFLPLSARAQVPSYQTPPLERVTYAASVNLAVPQTGAGDAVCIAGSATKVVRIKRIAISGIDSTAQTATANLVLRSTANSGGTSTAPTGNPLDFANTAAATATLKAYTAVPTPGTSAGTVRAQSVGFAAATAGTPAPITWTFDPTQLQQEVVLRSTAQSACLNFPNAFTTAGPTINVDVTWTE